MIKKISANQYFDFMQIGTYAYAAIKKNDSLMSNAGVIDLGGTVVVYDTFLSIQAAKKLREIIDEQFKPNRLIVVNSHGHLDHIIGNCAFSDAASIISSTVTFQMIKQYQEQFAFGSEHYETELTALEEQLKLATDKEEILNLENSMILYNSLCQEEGKFIIPNLICDDKLVIKGTEKECDVITIPKAHLSGEIVCILKDEKIAFIGDLVFNEEHPYIGAGDPNTLITELEKLLESDLLYFIPGHGAICDKKVISDQITYINSIIELVKVNHERADDLKPCDLPDKFQHWKATTFRWNIDFLKTYLNKS